MSDELDNLNEEEKYWMYNPQSYYGKFMADYTDNMNWNEHLFNPASCPPPSIAYNPYKKFDFDI